MSVAPLQFLLLVFAGWVNRRQVEILEYLREENRILREQLGSRRLRFTDAQRRRLATKGQALGRRVLQQLAGRVGGERRGRQASDHRLRILIWTHLRSRW